MHWEVYFYSHNAFDAMYVIFSYVHHQSHRSNLLMVAAQNVYKVYVAFVCSLPLSFILLIVKGERSVNVKNMVWFPLS